MWGTLSSLLPEVLSGLTTNPWYFRALEIHLYKTWTKKGKKPGGHELPLVRQMTCSFINETITLERGSKHIPSSLYNPQFSQAKPFNWAMTMEYLIVAWKFWRNPLFRKRHFDNYGTTPDKCGFNRQSDFWLPGSVYRTWSCNYATKWAGCFFKGNIVLCSIIGS